MVLNNEILLYLMSLKTLSDFKDCPLFINKSGFFLCSSYIDNFSKDVSLGKLESPANLKLFFSTLYTDGFIFIHLYVFHLLFRPNTISCFQDELVIILRMWGPQIVSMAPLSISILLSRLIHRNRLSYL